MTILHISRVPNISKDKVSIKNLCKWETIQIDTYSIQVKKISFNRSFSIYKSKVSKKTHSFAGTYLCNKSVINFSRYGNRAVDWFQITWDSGLVPLWFLLRYYEQKWYNFHEILSIYYPNIICRAIWWSFPSSQRCKCTDQSRGLCLAGCLHDSLCGMLIMTVRVQKLLAPFRIQWRHLRSI